MSAQEIVGRYVEVRDTLVYYESCGEGVPLICIHSAGTNNRLYRHTLPTLAPHGLKVIAPDLPGHGKSMPIDWTPIDDLHEFGEWTMELAAALGLERPVVMGCSIGGDIAIDLAVSRSADIRAAIAFEGAAYTPTFPGSATLQEPHTVCWEGFTDVVAPAAIRPDATRDQVKEIAWLHTGGGQRFFANDLVGWDTQDLRDRLGEVSAPIMIGLGLGDWFLPEEFVTPTVEGIPHATYVRFENLGHWPMWEDPDTVNEAILDFLRTNEVMTQPRAAAGG
jgi:pimeloyl-ACP methyl ester carboxylesterase